jgi:CheY-like chemotaxis protein
MDDVTLTCANFDLFDFNQRTLWHHLKYKVAEEDIFENGALLLDSMTKHQYDLILLDIEMPVLNGCEAVKRIREYDDTSNMIEGVEDEEFDALEDMETDVPPAVRSSSLLLLPASPPSTPVPTPSSIKPVSRTSSTSSRYSMKSNASEISVPESISSSNPWTPTQRYPSPNHHLDQLNVSKINTTTTTSSSPFNSPTYLSSPIRYPTSNTTSNNTTTIPTTNPPPISFSILPENQNVPIIAITSLSGTEETEYYYSIGINKVVTKPFHQSPGDLIAWIHEYLSS